MSCASSCSLCRAWKATRSPADHGPENNDRSRAVAKIRSQNASRSPASFSRPSSSTASSGNAVSTRSAYSPRPSWRAARPSWSYRGMARMPQLGDLALNTYPSSPSAGRGRAAIASVRGFCGGIVFGTMIVAVSAVSGLDPKAQLPHPPGFLPVLTTILGMLFGAIGGWLRSRHDRRERLAARTAH